MTSASYPVGSNPAPSRHSFLVHLQSLTDISRELQTQVEGIVKPLDGVSTLLGDPPGFGPFSEGSTLTTWSHDAASQMQGLISDVRSALQFADEVTRTVATGYAQADDDISWGIGGSAPVGTVVGIAAGTAGAATAAVGGITAGIGAAVGHTVDDVAQTVTGVGAAAGDTVGRVLGGATPVVPVGSIVGALTGQPQPTAGGIL